LLGALRACDRGKYLGADQVAHFGGVPIVFEPTAEEHGDLFVGRLAFDQGC
jgi:hypothetical protein